MRRLLLIVILMCSASPALAQNALVGTWKSELGDSAIAIKSDGTYTITSPGQFDYNGKYTVSGQSVTFEDAFGSQFCPGIKGTYNFNVVVNSLRFEAVEDFCNARRDLMRGDWTNTGAT
jgi:hypothetical protein